jgi:hypothetical protein
MTFTYELIEAKGFKSLKRIDENGDVVWVPFDESNSDYQRYLNPEAEQSTPSVD